MAAAGQSGSTPTPADGDPVPPDRPPEQLATRCCERSRHRNAEFEPVTAVSVAVSG